MTFLKFVGLKTSYSEGVLTASRLVRNIFFQVTMSFSEGREGNSIFFRVRVCALSFWKTLKF